MAKKNDSWYWNIWREGTAFDAWTLTHILSGGWMASLILLLDIEPTGGFLASFLLMVAWEIYEVGKGIHEWMGNKIMDVVTGVLGYFAVYFLQVKMSHFDGLVFFDGIFVAYLVFVAFGFAAYMRRTGKWMV